MLKILVLQLLCPWVTGSNSGKHICFNKLPLMEFIFSLYAPSLLETNGHFFYVFLGRRRPYIRGSQFNCIFKSLQEFVVVVVAVAAAAAPVFNPDTQDKAQVTYLTNFGLKFSLQASGHTVFCCQNQRNSCFSIKVNSIPSLLSLYISMLIHSIKF